jgi:tetratricopeptide (TPR) repeat protein
MESEYSADNNRISRLMGEAYHALQKDNLPTAMDRYQQVLEISPEQNEAKFGLATIYHRMGEWIMARNLYSEILAAEPGNLEALNNLLVLVGQESPKEALAQLEKLAEQNPDFSPLPAQMAAIYSQMQQYPQAIASIRRAMQIDPDNLAYRYNAAVLMDRAGKRREAIELYVELKHSYERGEKVPADMAAIQERLTFLLSNRG